MEASGKKKRSKYRLVFTENCFKNQNTAVFSMNPLISVPLLVVALEQISITTIQASLYLIPAVDIEYYLRKDALDNWTTINSFIYYFNRGAKEILTSLELSGVDNKGRHAHDTVKFDAIIASFKALKRL